MGEPRFADGKYRDCKWCGGLGCISCEAEVDKEYKRQFPDGPKPIMTIDINDNEGMEALKKMIHGEK